MIRALLIGSSRPDLLVHPSVQAMDTWLCGRGFQPHETEHLTGARATRDNILAGLQRLAVGPDLGDAPVVVYYAGHGYLYRSEIGAGAGGHAAYPLLVAADIDASCSGPLRSVLGSELSRELQQLALRARNLTVILDCCHASGMVRLDDELEGEAQRAQELALREEASARLRRTRGPVMRGPAIVPPTRLSEQVVVVAASCAGGRAYPDPQTERMVFTDALIAALDRHPTWDAVLAETRARVQEVWPIQHPAVFGPRFRRPLTLDEDLPEGELFHVERKDEQVVLMAGALSSIDPSDRFELIPFASTTYGPELVLGTARPRAIRPDRTVLESPRAARLLPQPCYAHRVGRGQRPAVALSGVDLKVRDELTALIARAGLRLASQDERDVVARVEQHEEGLRVLDHLGELVHLAPPGFLPAEDLHRCLRRLDRWRGVSRWLARDSSGRPLRRCYDLRWGPPAQLAATRPGEVRVRPGDALAIALHNLDRGEPELYAQGFRIRADREIRPWNPETGALYFAAYQGVGAGQRRQDGESHAFTVDAPPALPPGLYREWTLVAVATEPFADDFLETPPDARALRAGLDPNRGQQTRGAEDERRVDIVAFPYVLELPTS